jgi:hypothetical protein
MHPRNCGGKFLKKLLAESISETVLMEPWPSPFLHLVQEIHFMGIKSDLLAAKKALADASNKIDAALKNYADKKAKLDANLKKAEAALDKAAAAASSAPAAAAPIKAAQAAIDAAGAAASSAS